MSSELKGTIIALAFTVLSFIVPGGRVLTIPLVFVLLLIWTYWWARVSVDREERREQQDEEQ
ncbi:MAG: hypothetical protein U0807_00270 [Candidatus Binatia bacterium]